MSQAFSAFKDSVRDGITVDGARHGVSLGNAKYFDRLVTAALLDLQSFVPQLKEGHRTVFKQFDVTEEGEASIGDIPDRAIITDSYYVTKTCHCIRRPFSPYPWESRFDLFCGKPRIVGWQYFFATNPFADEFVIYPKLSSTSELWLYWSGIKSSWQDADEVKFGEEEAQAAAYYVKSHICREVDKDLTLAASYWLSYAGSPAMMGLRTRLFLDWKRRAEGAPASTSPQPEKISACDCNVTVCCFTSPTDDCGFSGGYFYLKGGDNLWHRITVTGDVGEEEFDIGEGVEAPVWDDCITGSAEGYGFYGGYFSLLNTDTNAFIAISLTGDANDFVFEAQKGELGAITKTPYAYRLDPCIKVLNVTTKEFVAFNPFP